MEVLSQIEAKVKELLDLKGNHQSIILKLSSDLETAKAVVQKIDGALEAFSAVNSSLKPALGVAEAVSMAVNEASDAVNAAATVEAAGQTVTSQ